MAIQISAEIEAFIAELVDAGDYPNAAAAIEDAFRALQLERESAHLVEMIQMGIDQAERGEVVEYTDDLRDQIRESAKRRFAAGERAKSFVRP